MPQAFQFGHKIESFIIKDELPIDQSFSSQFSKADGPNHDIIPFPNYFRRDIFLRHGSPKIHVSTNLSAAVVKLFMEKKIVTHREEVYL